MNEMPPLNLPPADLKFERSGGILKVFDKLRKKFVALTPEEYVRQNFVGWLIDSKKYPASLMANEIGIEVNGTKRRCDTVIFNNDGTLRMIIEYKAPDVAITQKVFDQIVNYNRALRAKYLVVSNGMCHYCCVMDYTGDSYQFIRVIPDYAGAGENFSVN